MTNPGDNYVDKHRYLPVADSHAYSSDSSTRLKSRHSAGYNVAQLQRWRASTTLPEKYPKDSGEESLDVVRVG